MRLFTTPLILLICLNAYSQNTGIGTTSPHPSAALEINDTMRGFLPPRMTTTQRDAIVNPAEGLQIYNLTTASPELFYQGQWRSFCSTSANQTHDLSTDLIQQDTIDFSCSLSSQRSLEVLDFAFDSIGNLFSFIKYSGKQQFYNQTLPCIDGSVRYMILKLTHSGDLIWKQDLNLTSAEITFGKLTVLTDGSVVMALSHYIGLGLTTTYTYNLGGQTFSFNTYSSNIVKLNSDGGYVTNRSFPSVYFSFFESNSTNTIGCIYRSVSGITGQPACVVVMLNGNSNTLGTIWQNNNISNSDFLGLALHPTENSLYFTQTVISGTTTALRLYKLFNLGIEMLQNLGNPAPGGPGSTYGRSNSTSIAFNNNKIHILTPTRWRIIQNNITYSGCLHLTLSAIDHSLISVYNENNEMELYYVLMKSVGNYVAQLVHRKNLSPPSTIHDITFRLFDQTGQSRFSQVNQYYHWTINDPIEILRISNSQQRCTLGGNIGKGYPGNFYLLSTTLPNISSNYINPFLLFLSIPN